MLFSILIFQYGTFFFDFVLPFHFLSITNATERTMGRTHKCEDCMTTERRELYDYLKESKEDMLSGALKENVIEE